MIALIGVALVGGGVFLIVQRDTGNRAKARVTDCVDTGGKYGSVDCTGTWVAGGSLVAGAGHVVSGPIDGANRSDIGKALDVTVSGEHAYTRSLRVPIILIGIGLFIAMTGVLVSVRGPTRS